MNHFAAKCRSSAPPSVCPVTNTEEQEEEIFQTHTPETKLDNSQLVTLQLDTGSHVRFQVDTGAQCNVVSLSVYKRATNDQTLRNVSPSRMKITAYGDATLQVIGTVVLLVWRGVFHCRLDCKLVDRMDICPLLGRKACLGMKIVSYLDNDALNKPETGNVPVYMISETGPITREELIKQYPMVFGDGDG